MIKKFISDESAVTAIEYGLIAALVAIVIILAIASVGTPLASKYSAIAVSVT